MTHIGSFNAQNDFNSHGCSAQTNAGWFPEDEANVAAYLNQRFYKFK